MLSIKKLRKVPDMYCRGTWAHFCCDRPQNVLYLSWLTGCQSIWNLGYILGSPTFWIPPQTYSKSTHILLKTLILMFGRFGPYVPEPRGGRVQNFCSWNTLMTYRIDWRKPEVYLFPVPQTKRTSSQPNANRVYKCILYLQKCAKKSKISHRVDDPMFSNGLFSENW
jgi:hypothetical protein